MCVEENGNYLTSVKYSILDGPELPELDLLTMKTVTFKSPDHCSENRDKVKEGVLHSSEVTASTSATTGKSANSHCCIMSTPDWLVITDSQNHED